MAPNVCCFIGNKNMTPTDELITMLTKRIETLITDRGVGTFLFGSKSRFDDLCLELVTRLKQKHPHIKRVYVRAEYQYIDDDYMSYLLTLYDHSYYPDRVHPGRAAYVQRNQVMIDSSDICIFYHHPSSAPNARRSGTSIALNYAVKRKKEIILFPNELTEGAEQENQ